MTFVAHRRFAVDCVVEDVPLALRRFIVECANADAAPAPLLTASETFSEAAMRYAEHWTGEDHEVRVIVTDEDSGAQECFTMSFERDEAPVG